MNKNFLGIYLVFFLILSSLTTTAQALKTKFGKQGLEELNYQGFSLLNIAKQQGGLLMVEDYKAIAKNRSVKTGLSRQIRGSMNISKGLYTGEYNWGTLDCWYQAVGDTLRISLKITNTSASDTLCGVNVFPLALSFQARPAGWQPYYIYYHFNIGTPTVISVNYGKGKMILCNDDVKTPLFAGFIDKQAAGGGDYKLWVSSIPTNGISTLAPVIEKKIAPGKSFTYRVSLRFCSPQVNEYTLAQDIYNKFRLAFPATISWPDRRPIGFLVLSSVENKSNKNNPRGWLPNIPVDVVSAKGKSDFYSKLMSYADQSIAISKKMNAQGVITWDIEGQEFPHALSYIGSPEKLNEVAPEMENIADAYFKKFTDAGLKVGICIRPDSVTLSADKKVLTRIPGNEFQQLVRKIGYARKRWGCKLFYIDSNGDPNFPSDPAVFKRLNKLYPDILLIPEHQTAEYFAYTAPYEEWRGGTERVPSISKLIYPKAFMVLNMADGVPDNKDKISVAKEKIKFAVSEGNILMFRAWYNDEPMQSLIKEAYKK